MLLKRRGNRGKGRKREGCISQSGISFNSSALLKIHT